MRVCRAWSTLARTIWRRLKRPRREEIQGLALRPAVGVPGGAGARSARPGHLCWPAGT